MQARTSKHTQYKPADIVLLTKNDELSKEIFMAISQQKTCKPMKSDAITEEALKTDLKTSSKT